VIVGFHSPLPPSPTGVADYASALLSALRKRAEIKVGSGDAEVCLYHLGNNALHRDVYRRALARPGVVVLHDAVLNHFFLGSLERAQYIAEFVYNYGDWYRDFAGELWDGRARSAGDARYFQYAMLRRIVETSRAVVVHNAAAARLVRAHSPDARIQEIPHLWAPPPEIPAGAADGFRLRLGIEPRTILFSVIGYLRESKRLPVVLKAFDEVHRKASKTALLVAGRFVSPDLEAAVATSMDRPGVYRVGWVPEAEFWPMAASLNACVNLRYPAAGESSGVAIRLMGLGKALIVSRSEESSAFPPSCCLPVAPGIAEQSELIEYMDLLARFPELAREIGSRGAAHIRERHSLEAVSEAYWKVLCECRD
jgi:glycosyltransferase involved in cell wall biosynthesis